MVKKKNLSKILPIIIFTSILMLSSCSVTERAMKSKDNALKLKIADELFAKKKYGSAQLLYEQLVYALRNTEKIEEIFFKYAQCAYLTKDFETAKFLFKEYMSNFSNYQRAEEIEFLTAMTYYAESPSVELDQSNTEKAISLLQTYTTNYKNGMNYEIAMKALEECKTKLELQRFNAAMLYYNMERFLAAAVTFNTIITDFPDTQKGDYYKLFAIKSLFQYASLSVEEKQKERFEKIIDEYNDFSNRYSDSKHKKEVDDIYQNTLTKLRTQPTVPIN